jgi:hypothetical protein
VSGAATEVTLSKKKESIFFATLITSHQHLARRPQGSAVGHFCVCAAGSLRVRDKGGELIK